MSLILKFLFLGCVSLSLFVASRAQTASEVVAKIGNQSLTLGDLNQTAQTTAAQLPQAVANARQQILEKEVAALLFAAEAKARNLTPEKLLELEVKKKVVLPTEARVQEVYEANRSAFGAATLAEAKSRIINYLKREQEEQLTNAFASSLKAKYKVAPGADINSPNLKPIDVLATVGANKLLASSALERLKPLEYNLRLNAYQQIKAALDETLYSNLILLEARRQNLPPEEIVKREILDKLIEPTETDAKKFYDERKASLNGESFENLKTQIFSYLAQEQRIRLEQSLRERLIKQNNAQILLKEPAPPILSISAANAPSKGNPNAPITIVMFSDFQCSACARTHPILSDILKTYRDKVRLIVRNFPLETIHENAFRAAQAAAAARAQNKFFEYAELLYQNQGALDDASLKKYAAQVGLNIQQFEADLASKKFDASIREDIKDGEFYGISGTPSVYVNGVIAKDLSAEGLKKVVENALVKK